VLEGGPVCRVPHDVATAGSLAIVAGEEDAGLGDDLHTGGAEAVARRHLGTDQPGSDRIGVALEGDKA
jgi:hypothetical protein